MFQDLTRRLTGLLALMLLSAPVFADWALVPEQSFIYFASSKNGSITEVHRFDRFEGELDPNKQGRLSIDLSSVNTSIPIRNERMQEHLFAVEQYPEAQVTVPLYGLENGTQTVKATLELHGYSTEITTRLHVSQADDSPYLRVSTAQPILLDAQDFGFGDGLEKLRELAALQSISPIVPVSFFLSFEEK